MNFRTRIFLVAAVFSVSFIPCSCSSETAQDDFNRGQALLREGKKEQAYKFFKKAAQKNETDGMYHWAAATVAPNQNAAFIHTEAAWKNGARRPDILSALIQLSFHTSEDQKKEYAFGLYMELPDSFRTPDLKADLLFGFGEVDSALVFWNELYRASGSPEWISRIAIAYSRKEMRDSAMAVLSRARALKALDRNAYLLLSSMLFYEGKTADIDKLFMESRENNQYDENLQLEYATLLVLQNRIPDACGILETLRDTVADSEHNLIRHHSRILYSYALAIKADSVGISGLHKYINAGKPAWRKAEGAWHSAILAVMRSDTSAFGQIRNLREQIASPVIMLVFAHECIRRGNMTEAVESLKLLPRAYLQAPAVAVEFAVALAGTGKDDDALVVLGQLHKRGLFTRPSLELFRDLTAKKNLVEKSLAAQKMLEKQFGDDAGVQWSGAMLAIKRGETDSALVLLDKLAKKYPKESRFEVARLSTLYLKGDYGKVVRECSLSTGPVESVAAIQARAYRKLNRTGEADAAFNKALGPKREPGILMEYADFLVTSQEPQKAVRIYQEILDKNKGQLGRDSMANAVVLNNLAWANLEIKTPDLDLAVWAARKAHELSPLNLHIIDTYADALLRAKKYKDCINLLDKDTLTAKEPRLMFHLASACEKIGNNNKALRYYQDILAAMNGTAVLPVSFSKDDISAKISSLTSDGAKK
jgi:predicted Zn-dependent protease